MSEPGDAPQRFIPARIVLVDRSVPCEKCEIVIPPGDVLIAQGSRFSHEVCPRLWEPEVIEGGAAGCSGGQLAFPMLGLIEGGQR